MNSILQRWHLFWLRREERRAMRLLGESLGRSPEILGVDEKLRGLQSAVAASMQRDRHDYAAVPGWARLLVVARGFFDRLITRALIRDARRQRATACEQLGRESAETAKGLDAEAARSARAAVQSAETAMTPLPLALREGQHFSRYLVKEARGQLVPRLPGLAGLAVGWWIAQTFTDSELSATLHGWGIGAGPRHAVKSETLRAMSFWLPLVAAAICSYAGSRLAALVKARYE